MCGRYSLALTREGLEVVYQARFEKTDVQWQPRYNIAPSQRVPVIVGNAVSKQRHLKFMKWGLIPGWSKDESMGVKLINARVETVDGKPSFKESFFKRRCLVPADGFFEWDHKKAPHRICQTGLTPFAFAGIWDVWRGPDGIPVESFAILTAEADPSIKNIHARMPIILDESAHQDWLDMEWKPAQKLFSLINESRRSLSLMSYIVSKHVNAPKNDDAQCLKAVSEVTEQNQELKKAAKDTAQMSLW